MLTIKSAPLWAPNLEELVPALQAGLAENYGTVSVSVVPCPDLREWGFVTPGISGNTGLIEVGGEPYAHNPRYRDMRFDMAEMAARCDHPRATILGAGMASPDVLDGHCGELIPSLQLAGANLSKVARVGADKECIVEAYPWTVHSGLSNLFLSDGVPGPVLRVSVAQRTGDEGSFTQALRKSLMAHPAIGAEKQLGLGGLFLVEKGQIRSHVMPDYDCIAHKYYDVETEQVIADFLQFYEHMGPDLLCLSVFWTGDPTGEGLHLRDSGEHTHFVHLEDKNQAGHYHYDVTPDEIQYTGYFNVAAQLYRVNDIYEELAQGTR